MNAITKAIWMNEPAFSLENDKLRAIILPRMGGKTASLVQKEAEFEVVAQNAKGYYARPTPDSPFDRHDASGLDDAFPTVVASQIEHGGKTFRYTDHGEIWRSSFESDVLGTALSLRYVSRENPFEYQKVVSLDGDRIVYKYHITNTGSCDWPCMWTMHGLVRYEEDMRLIYPNGAKRIQNAAQSPRLGARNAILDIQNPDYDFYGVPARDSNATVKYYLADRVFMGQCGYYYPRFHMRCLIEYDADALPYLGFWVTAGGYRGDYNCAFEPSNGFYDAIDVAKQNGALPILKKGCSLDFFVSIRLPQRDCP